ncbi:hypothetical protein [Deinococcus sonorensis]|uniref:Uncharacterized protein n=1 Tax=Deinococcus sonorensis TaxID=309891 RepID=A0ABV8YBA6_9DEIO
MKIRVLLTVLAALTTQARAVDASVTPPLLSLIDTGGQQLGSPYRSTPFVELLTPGQSGREISVPYVPALDARAVAGDEVYEWGRFQERVKWASTVGLNSSVTAGLGSPEDLYLTNCLLQVPADVSIALKQALAGVSNLSPTPAPEVAVSDPLSEPWTYDQVDLYNPQKAITAEQLPTLTPRIDRTSYCADASLDPAPDIPVAYLPGVQTCTPFGCLSTPNYPQPLYINWPLLAERMWQACQNAVAGYADYQKNVLQSVATHLPAAVSWDGLPAPHGDRSGTVMSPVVGEGSVLPSAAKLATQNPQWLLYFNTTFKTLKEGFLPGQGAASGAPGVSTLEAFKRRLEPGTLQEQAVHGYATLFETWQQLDTVVDVRPTVYWSTSLECVLFDCTPVPVPLPAPDLLVTPEGCTVPNPGTIGAGSTTFTMPRFHNGYVSVPEGYAVPGLMGEPSLRLPGGD